MILISAFIKLYFLVFLLFPIILDKKYIAVAIFIVTFVLIYSSNYFFSPAMFSEFVTGVTYISRDSNAIGRSLYTLTYSGSHFLFAADDNRALFFALAIHAAISSIILLLAYAVFQNRSRPEQFNVLCCWLFLSAFLMSPRLVDYDIPIMVVPIVLIGRMLLSEKGVGISVVAIVSVLGTCLMRTAFSGLGEHLCNRWCLAWRRRSLAGKSLRKQRIIDKA